MHNSCGAWLQYSQHDPHRAGEQASETFARGGSGALPHEDRMLSAGLCVSSSTLTYADADMASTVSSRRLIVHEWQDGSKCRA
jgi:hypothetical protein